LAFIDPDDRTPLETVIKYYKHPVIEVYANTRLDVLLELFKKGQTHLVVVVAIAEKVRRWQAPPRQP
jgi:metal transporter CNNM